MPNTVVRFRATVELNLNGETVRVTTVYPDFLWAERAMGEAATEAPLDSQGHAYYSALRRQHPDHPAARTMRDFNESLWGFTQVQDESEPPEPGANGNGLDPTPVAASGA